MADLTPQVEPLEEATLDELFARDPQELTSPDRERILAAYRASKLRFDEAAAQGKRVSRSKAPSGPKLKIDMAAALDALPKL
jgi:hypothetical protein